MSFFSAANRDNKNCPGPVVSSEEAMCIKEKVCIQVKKVYDACIQQDLLENEMVEVKICGSYALPLKFIKCRNSTASGIVEDLRVDRLPDRKNFARVRAKVKIPLQVEFVDADGVKGTGIGYITIPKDVILFVPDESIIPFEIEATVGAVCTDGEYVTVEESSTGSECIYYYIFKLNICYTIILKVIAEVELLIPAFGFCCIPPCEEFAENICEEFFSLPLFPPQLKCLPRTDD